MLAVFAVELSILYKSTTLAFSITSGGTPSVLVSLLLPPLPSPPLPPVPLPPSEPVVSFGAPASPPWFPLPVVPLLVPALVEVADDEP